MKLSYVYILKCADGTYYTGVTTDLTQRLEDHMSGKYKGSYTSKRLPLELVFFADFTDINLAIDCEKQIKRWSKLKKEALIKGNYEDLPNLAKKSFKDDFSIRFSHTSKNTRSDARIE